MHPAPAAQDARGFLARLFCADELAAAGWPGPVVQINHTHTAERGTVRGLHYQRPPAPEAKLVSCLRGAVWTWPWTCADRLAHLFALARARAVGAQPHPR